MLGKERVGNKASTFVTLGGSNHSNKEREKHDYYATEPKAMEFAQRALDSVQVGKKVAIFLKLQFLEGKARKQFFLKNPPKTIYVCSSRLNCVMNGEFEKYKSSVIAYAWFVWEKGFKGDPIIKWIN